MNEYNNLGVEQVIGLDVSDRKTTFKILNGPGSSPSQGKVDTTPRDLSSFFLSQPRSLIVVETGTHSPWISRLVQECGHKVVVSNARKVALVSTNKNKDDPVDADLLARLGRADIQLLYPVQHRGAQAQADLVLLRARDAVVRARSRLVGYVRQTVKSFGGRLPKCGTEAFASKVKGSIPKELGPSLTPLLMTIMQLNSRIKQYDRKIETRARTRYAKETGAVRQVKGVGEVIGMAYVLTLEDPHRFRRSRQVGAYLGLACGRDNSGDTRRQLSITKQGDRFLRSLLIQAAHYILGAFGPDSDLRRFGLQLYSRGGKTKRAKRRATVAVARKLAVLLHHLWISGEEYEPLYQHHRRELRAAVQGEQRCQLNQ